MKEILLTIAFLVMQFAARNPGEQILFAFIFAFFFIIFALSSLDEYEREQERKRKYMFNSQE